MAVNYLRPTNSFVYILCAGGKPVAVLPKNVTIDDRQAKLDELMALDSSAALEKVPIIDLLTDPIVPAYINGFDPLKPATAG